MEKILNLALEIFNHVQAVDPAVAEKIKAATSAIVDEADGLSKSFALAVHSGGRVNATSPAPTPKTDSAAASVTTGAGGYETPEAAPVFLHPIYGTPVK